MPISPRKITDYSYEIPRSYRSDMRVAARVFLNADLLRHVIQDTSLEQLVNMTTLPGIQEYALAMPDIHQGYGFPIGGVAAMSLDDGVISPGGIGYDINCGVRLLASSLSLPDARAYLPKLADKLFELVPSGVGRGGSLKLSPQELEHILAYGAPQALTMGYGLPEDIELCEENGSMSNADPALVSYRAKQRGTDQLGTLGSGNHFLEVQYVESILDPVTAQAFGLSKDQITVMIHCGSRGLGHQTCTDYVRLMLDKLSHWGIELPDRELACAPINSHEGQQYFNAMAAAANFAWANRHVIAHHTRQAFKQVFGTSTQLNQVYDLSHNIGKKESHILNNTQQTLMLHRKGATRAFGPGRSEIPAAYRSFGQPVLIPGTMGTHSYVLAGTQTAMNTSFGSCCHGAGRQMSRMQAKKTVQGTTLRHQLEAQGILIRCDSSAGLAEEAPLAYKDVDEVINIVEHAGLARPVARLAPLAVIKGG